MSAALTLAASLPPGDSGGPGYVVAALVAVAVVVLAYLVIVAFRVRDAARRLDALEERTREAEAAGDAVGTTDERDPREVVR